VAITLSAVHGGRPFTLDRSPGTHFFNGYMKPGVIARLEELGTLRTFSYLTGFRARDLPACSIMPQPSTLPRAPCPISSPFILQPYVTIARMRL
jgi:hypothetical protein